MDMRTRDLALPHSTNDTSLMIVAPFDCIMNVGAVVVLVGVGMFSACFVVVVVVLAGDFNRFWDNAVPGHVALLFAQ